MIVTLELKQGDALPGILAQLGAIQAERVLFVVPRGCRLDAIDLRSLRRAAAERRMGVALVTSDAGVRAAAAREGISTFRSRAWALRVRWRRPRADPAVRLHPDSPAATVVPPGPGLYARRSPSGFRATAFPRAFGRGSSPWWALLGLIICLLALLGGLLYAFTLVIPDATITMAPASEPIQVTVPVKAIQDARLDVEAGIVPAQALSAQVSGEARTETTGRRNEPATRSKGRVVFINRTGREMLVPAGTVVATSTGNNVQFTTTADLLLAPNSRAAVSVEAVLPGPGGNVRAGTVTRVEGPLGLSLLVANEGGFSGGTTAQMGVVTEEDKARLQAQLFAELKQQALERLNERVEGRRFIPPESVTYLVLSPTFTPFVGEVSPDLYLRMSVQAVGVAADIESADQVAMVRLQAAMPQGTRLISDTVHYSPGPVTAEDPTTVSFSVTAQGILLRSVDVAAVRAAVRGIAPAEAERALMARFALARSPEIRLGPDWLPYIVPIDLPQLRWRIRVVVDWDTAARLAMNR